MSVGSCVCALSLSDSQMYSQAVSQRTVMPLVVCCGCGGDKRLTVGFYHFMYVCVGVCGSVSKLRRNKYGFIKADTLICGMKPITADILC